MKRYLILAAALAAFALLCRTPAPPALAAPAAESVLAGQSGTPAESVLSAAAPVPGEDMPGRDLRTRRGYGSGLINKEKELYVLYFLFDNNVLVVYRNEPDMERLLAIDLSASPDPRAAEEGMVFEDQNGDGYNDMRIPVAPGKWKTWRWIPAEGCFQEQ